MKLSPDQVAALDRIGAWFDRVDGHVRYCDDEDCGSGNRPHTHGDEGGGLAPVMGLGGLAGTGKTTLMRRLEGALGARVWYVTPTHKALGVLRGKLDQWQRARTSTCHSLLYRAITYDICATSGERVEALEGDGTADGACSHVDRGDCDCVRRYVPCSGGAAGRHVCRVEEELRWERRQHAAGHMSLLVVDEASMVAAEVVEDIRSLGVPVLLVGDHGQLPPVKAAMSSWIAEPAVVLTENHRQSEASGIVPAALRVRETGRLPLGRYGDGSTAVVAVDQPGVRQLLEPGRFVPGVDRAVIAPTNRFRANVNKRFHGDGPPRAGDRVVALGRNKVSLVTWFEEAEPGSGRPPTYEVDVRSELTAHNGRTGTVLHTSVATPTKIQLVVRLDPEGPEDTGKMVLTEPTALRQYGADTKLAKNERPSGTQLWDYAYALTCHKAQGSEFDDVLVLDQGTWDYARWMYTATTRARRRLVVVRWGR